MGYLMRFCLFDFIDIYLTSPGSSLERFENRVQLEREENSKI